MGEQRPHRLAYLVPASPSANALTVIEARSPEDLVPAFTLVRSARPDVLYVLSAAFFVSQRARIVELVNARRQVAVYGQSDFADPAA
jgi:hypothetical protein